MAHGAANAPHRWMLATDRVPAGTFSIHASAEEADQTLDRVLTVHADKDGAPDEVTVTLAERTVGDITVGTTHHEPAPHLPNPPTEQDRP